jgi:hypothetical protein
MVPHYFFNANGPGQAIGDSEGKRLWDLEAAHRIAVETARGLVRDAALQWEDWSFEITDDAGQMLLLVPFSDALVRH